MHVAQMKRPHEQLRPTLGSLHLRSEVGVGASVSSSPSLHTVSAVHSRSLVTVAAVDS